MTVYNVSTQTATSFDVIERAAAAIVNVTGSTATERKLSVINDMSRPALIATAAFGGKTGKTAMGLIVKDVAFDLAAPAAWPRCDYKPLAQTLAAQLGEVVVVSNRASFLGLIDQFEAKIMTHCAKSKSGGFKVDAKTGAEVPDAAHSKLIQLRDLIRNVTKLAEDIGAENKAKHEAEKAEKLAKLQSEKGAE